MNIRELFKRLARITGIKPEDRPELSKMNRDLLNYYYKQGGV